MYKFVDDFNCCKTVGCKNFAVTNSDDYIQQSKRLGYLSIECKLCGSNPPWINNAVVEKILQEKLTFQFARKLTNCPKCHQYFFFSEPSEAKLYGFTSAGTQRKKCHQCHTVFTAPNYKNISALSRVLTSILANKEIRLSIKASGLPARLYYFYLNQLAILLTNFSRLNEEKALKKQHLGLNSEGKVISLDHRRGIYTVITSEMESGYILLQSNNLTQQPLTAKDVYQSKENTIISSKHSNNLENVLLDRYQQNMTRKHFECLLVGELKTINKCHLIYPDKLAYIHFQLLNAFTTKAQTYSHYIEHESCFRSASLMASAADIKKLTANIYFFLPSRQASDSFQGKKLGWWNDKWFSNELGAFCPITANIKNANSFKLPATNSVNLFYAYLDKHLNKGLNSMNVIDNLCEIHRVIFNYCEINEATTRAQSLQVSNKIYNPETLLNAALKAIMN